MMREVVSSLTGKFILSTWLVCGICFPVKYPVFRVTFLVENELNFFNQIVAGAVEGEVANRINLKKLIVADWSTRLLLHC